MLNNISWASYAYAISFMLLIYYVLVIAIFFREDLQELLPKYNGRLFKRMDKGTFGSQNAADDPKEILAEKSQSNDTEELQLSLQSLIKKAAARKFPKEELLQSLRLGLQNYPVLKDSQLTAGINNFIKNECANNCSIHLSDDEVKMLWGVEVGGAS